MKIQKALDLIEDSRLRSGFMVHFEWVSGCILRSDHFPEVGIEELIETEGGAWELAEKFAKAMKSKICNVYVVNSNHQPVPGYDKKRLLPQPPHDEFENVTVEDYKE